MTGCSRRNYAFSWECAIVSSCLSPHPAESGSSSVGKDFNRNYYDQLKAEYNSDLVRIFAKEDYELDDMDTPWLSDYRGRDIEKLREKVKDRPKPPGMSFAPLLLTDLHSEEELESFEERARTHDPVSGRCWDDPPPDIPPSDGQQFSDLRPCPEDVLNQPDDPELHKLKFQPALAKQFESEEDEINALQQAFSDMQAAELMKDTSTIATHDQFPIPSRTNFSKWEQASTIRGGDSTVSDSYFLPPAANRAQDEHHAQVDKQKISPAQKVAVPKQYNALTSAHGGVWHGTLDVYALGWEDNELHVTHSRTHSVETTVVETNALSMKWDSSIQVESQERLELKSSTVLSSPPNINDLSPERAVFENGSYVQQKGVSKLSVSANVSLSLGPEVIQTLANCKRASGAVEICLMSRRRTATSRIRVFLCTTPGLDIASAGALKKIGQSAPVFSHIIAIEEALRTSGVQDSEVRDPRSSCCSFDPDLLLGEWRGSGVSLHPLYPPMSACSVTSEQSSWQPPSPILPRNVTWTEEDYTTMTDRGSERDDKLKKRKRSRRVSEAMQHDARRLLHCSLLYRDRIGAEPPQTHAWQWTPGSASLYSPRLGKFVGDYFAISLPGRHYLFAPAGVAWPDQRSTISLTSPGERIRSRIVAARSVEGDLVGVAYLDEQRHDSNSTG